MTGLVTAHSSEMAGGISDEREWEVSPLLEAIGNHVLSPKQPKAEI